MLGTKVKTGVSFTMNDEVRNTFGISPEIQVGYSQYSQKIMVLISLGAEMRAGVTAL